MAIAPNNAFQLSAFPLSAHTRHNSASPLAKHATAAACTAAVFPPVNETTDSGLRASTFVDASNASFDKFNHAITNVAPRVARIVCAPCTTPY
jgi:hypothetical protein